MTKPNVTCEMAKEMIQHLFGLEVLNIEEMVSYDDRNFHIQVSLEHKNPYITSINDEGYTLKIANAANTAKPGYIDSVHCALKFLHEKGLRVPLPVQNLTGKTWTSRKVPLLSNSEDKNEESVKGTCGVHLLTYISGIPVNTLTYTENILNQWGRLLAQFHNNVEDFSNITLYDKDIFWGLAHVPDIAQYMDGLNKEKTKLVTDVLQSYSKLIQTISNMPKGYIHGDFNETNILARKTSSGYLVDGILDLEDMHYGTYVWDVGLMLAYVSLGCDNMDPIEGMGHALSGYLELRALTDEEISVLKICIACRLCQSLVMGAYNFKLHPENSYFILSERSGWNRLNLIWNTPNETIIKKWGIKLKNFKEAMY